MDKVRDQLDDTLDDATDRGRSAHDDVTGAGGGVGDFVMPRLDNDNTSTGMGDADDQQDRAEDTIDRVTGR